MKQNNIQIPEGYKNSSLGIIPNDWEVKKFKTICKEARLGGNYENSESNIGVPVIKMGNIGRGKIILDLIQCVPSNYKYNQYDVLQKGDLLFNTRNTLELVGKVAIWNNELPLAIYNSNLLRMYFDKKYVLSNAYINYYFNSHNALRQLKKYATGTTSVAAIYGRDLEHLKFSLPPLAEQQKIAEILGTWDEAIEKQSTLIDKLTGRKRGLMQQLLTGKKRLAGFNEKWKEYTYSEILKEVKRELEWNDNELYQLISVRRRSGGLFLRERLYGREIKTKNLRPAFTGDFLISKMQIVHGASGLTTATYNNMKISGSYISLISKNNKILNIEYLNFWSKTPRFYHQTYISSYGVHIEKMTFDIETFYAQSIKLPSKLEQDSIVDILTAADKEIELAKLKLELLRSQKSGLMQQLLTGKTLVNI